jgi:hypothetical protein
MSTILAVDLGKYNSVACWYEPDTRSAAYRTVATTPDDLCRAPPRVRHSSLRSAPSPGSG